MKKYTYKIYHEYQIGDQSVTFRCSIEPEEMKDLLAALEFHYEEHIDDSDSVCGRAATEVISKLYTPVEYLEKPLEPFFEINTYYNREQRCGISDSLMKEFNFKGLIELLKIENDKETNRILSVLANYKENEVDNNTVI